MSNYEPKEMSTMGNGRSVQDMMAPTSFRDMGMEDEEEFEPEEHGTEGNGFAEQDGRNEEHQEHMHERTKEFFKTGKEDMKDPLTE